MNEAPFSHVPCDPSWKGALWSLLVKFRRIHTCSIPPSQAIWTGNDTLSVVYIALLLLYLRHLKRKGIQIQNSLKNDLKSLLGPFITSPFSWAGCFFTIDTDDSPPMSGGNQPGSSLGRTVKTLFTQEVTPSQWHYNPDQHEALGPGTMGTNWLGPRVDAARCGLCSSPLRHELSIAVPQSQDSLERSSTTHSPPKIPSDWWILYLILQAIWKATLLGQKTYYYPVPLTSTSLASAFSHRWQTQFLQQTRAQKKAEPPRHGNVLPVIIYRTLPVSLCWN